MKERWLRPKKNVSLRLPDPPKFGGKKKKCRVGKVFMLLKMFVVVAKSRVSKHFLASKEWFHLTENIPPILYWATVILRVNRLDRLHRISC